MSRAIVWPAVPRLRLDTIDHSPGTTVTGWRRGMITGWAACSAIVIAFQIPYRLYALRRPEHPLLPTLSWQAALGYGLIGLLIGNWLLDVAVGRLRSP